MLARNRLVYVLCAHDFCKEKYLSSGSEYLFNLLQHVVRSQASKTLNDWVS